MRAGFHCGITSIRYEICVGHAIVMSFCLLLAGVLLSWLRGGVNANEHSTADDRNNTHSTEQHRVVFAGIHIVTYLSKTQLIFVTEKLYFIVSPGFSSIGNDVVASNVF
jgi:hypothetical protein